jgi:hypothetical protein
MNDKMLHSNNHDKIFPILKNWLNISNDQN